MTRRTRRFGFSLVLALAGLVGSAGLARAGDVLVGGVTPGGDLNINGDVGDNSFTVHQNADGSVTVTPDPGTTVNGNAGPYTTTPPGQGGTAVTGKIKIKGRGGNDTIKVDGVNQASDIEIKDDQGNNTVDVKNVNITGRLRIKNGRGGTTTIGDSKWGSRKIDGGATVNPANLAGQGGGGQVGTPPNRPTGGGGGGKKPARKKAATQKPPVQAQKDGLPTSNPGQRGMLPDVPNVPQPSYPSSPKTVPKGKY